MALTRLDLVGDGTTTVYDVSFASGYLREEFVYVYLEGEEPTNQLGYSWFNDTQIELDSAVPVGTEFHIRRIVPRDKPVNDYEKGAILREGNIDDSFIQALMIFEEIMDGYLVTEGPAFMNQDLDMNDFRIINCLTLEEPGEHDVANVAYVKRLTGSLAEYWAKIAEGFAKETQEDRDVVEALSAQWREDYLGNFTILPEAVNFPDGIADGALMYYDGVVHSQGLYIYYDYRDDEYTGKWTQVSGVGKQGPEGKQGVEGPPGDKGDQGLEGPQGIQGQQGIQGAIGDTGAAGPKGETGATGPQGIQGVQGEKGDQGIRGQVGPEGPQGIQGIQGPIGVKGDQGDDGYSFQIDATGLLSERPLHDDELKGYAFYALDYEVRTDAVPEFLRFKGDGTTTSYQLNWTPDGQQSLVVQLAGVTQGPDNYDVNIVGDVYTIVFKTAPQVGTNILIREVTLSTGYGAIYIKLSDASADWSDAIPFGKGPRGEQGAQGVQGATGPQGAVGAQGADGVQGIQGPTGNVGATGPQGATGDVGPQGRKGDAGDRGPVGIQGAEGQRGPAGAQGPQGNQGSRGPQGAEGKTGAKGERGDQGSQGPQGKQGPEGNKGASGDDATVSLVTNYDWIGKVINDSNTDFVPSENAGVIHKFDVTVEKDYDRLLFPPAMKADMSVKGKFTSVPRGDVVMWCTFKNIDTGEKFESKRVSTSYTQDGELDTVTIGWDEYCTIPSQSTPLIAFYLNASLKATFGGEATLTFSPVFLTDNVTPLPTFIKGAEFVSSDPHLPNPPTPTAP